MEVSVGVVTSFGIVFIVDPSSPRQPVQREVARIPRQSGASLGSTQTHSFLGFPVEIVIGGARYGSLLQLH